MQYTLVDIVEGFLSTGKFLCITIAQEDVTR